MVGRDFVARARERARGAGPLPRARVVHGGEFPEAVAVPAPSAPSGVTYERIREGREGAVALFFGFFPVIAILSMGIAMVWSASVFSGP